MFALAPLRPWEGLKKTAWTVSFRLVSVAIASVAAACWLLPCSSAAEDLAPGIIYTNYQISRVPWSIHVVRVDRPFVNYDLHTLHAHGRALGLSTVRDQVALLDSTLGSPVAAVNGDFYQRERGSYAGDPRGLQIIENEVISAPVGSPGFWVDALGDLHATNVASFFRIVWPEGTVTPFGLNEERRSDRAVLYTPAAGASTRTVGGKEFVLEAKDGAAWLPLRVGRTYEARVKELGRNGNTPLKPGLLVLSLGPAIAGRFQDIGPGANLQIFTTTLPSLRGVKTAISGGPILLADGKKIKLHASYYESYESSSMLERHPRTAIGWSDKAFFLVEVDGRQQDLSIGMTLDELSSFLLKLGCTDGMNLDGGGSSTFWWDGDVRNSPCDGRERSLANSIVVARKPRPAGPTNASTQH